SDHRLDLEHRTAYRFSIISALSTRCMLDLYRKLGLTVGGWRTLSIIGRYEPIHPGSIAERTSVDPDKVTRAVDRLVAKRLVARKVDSVDRRRIVLTLTARGRRVYAEIDGVRRAVEQKFLSVLTRDELARFNATMDKLEAQARAIFSGKGAWRELLPDVAARVSAPAKAPRRP
ncbi:MAG: MarR family transcriptional regulator, partial [Proteobacteria bacterium]|nr:MarR family transcriptional regulator [Pseudomonadota bacterium]